MSISSYFLDRAEAQIQDGIVDRLQVFSIRSAHSVRIDEISPEP